MRKEAVYCPPIDIDAETIVHLLDNSAYPTSRSNRPPSRPTIFRWIRDGIIDHATGARKVLATIQRGGQTFTSIEAIRRFNAGPGAPEVTPSQRKRMASAAMSALEAAGV